MSKQTRTLNSDGTVTITTTVEIEVGLTIPEQYADEVSGWDFQDQVAYIVGEATDNIVGDSLDPVIVVLYDEDGVEETGEAEVTATVEYVAY